MYTNLSKTLLFLFFCYSIFVVVNQLQFFGLSYDESLFINAATGKDETTFISKHWHGIPIMVMDYIGALKSWLYMPIFKIFGVNLLSIRLPMVILMYLNIYLIYIIGIKYFEKPVIIALIILLFTDFTFINLHKIDHGPSAIETFLKLISLFFVSKWKDLKSSLFIFIALLLGLFNKLNFIWYINALFGTYVISVFYEAVANINFKQISKLFLHKSFIINSLLFILILSFFVFQLKTHNIRPSRHTDFSQFINQATYQYNLLVVTILNLRYGYLLGWNYFQLMNYTSANIFLAAIFSMNIYWFFKRKDGLYVIQRQLFLLVLLISIQYLFTKEASNMWHILLLYPFLQLLILNTIYLVFVKIFPKFNTVFIVFCGVWVAFNIFTYFNLQKKINESCSFWLYEPKINTLIDFVNKRPENQIVSLGYGIHSQLLVMDTKQKTYLEIMASSGLENMNATLISKNNFIKKSNETLVIENLKSNLNTKRENYEAAKIVFTKLGIKMKKISTINDGCGDALYHIYKLEK